LVRSTSIAPVERVRRQDRGSGATHGGLRRRGDQHSPLYAYTLDMVDGLVETLEDQAVIAQATGVILAGEQLTTDEAFDRLRQLAMVSRESMRTVADWLLEERPTGPLPVDGHLPLREEP
jgi:hypothetical protein